MEPLVEASLLVGVVVFGILFGWLYLRNKPMSTRKKFKFITTSWGMMIVGFLLILIHSAVYFLDATQFELPQLFIGIGMACAGVYYHYKYKKEGKI